eukprot:CAMPEP_0183719080 /NCGR_PEP_ID=MMETSP0737-20130205/12162_1 /TAXON_ID=385413 /ORGANISM="Thalassiosira miniscula, Strain CCMP1093" /LENGTH=335 /DNA_ID=CAMNT_0025948767 /DNA_START=66 /DNA_END=1073 /DNA_ORIENTATION=+
MINRQKNALQRKSTPHPLEEGKATGRAIVIDSSAQSGTPSKSKKYNRRDSKLKHTNNKTSRFYLSLVAIIFAAACLAMLFPVDLSFLGGVFLVGLEVDSTKSSAGAALTKTAAQQHHVRRTESRFPKNWKHYSYNDIRDHFHCRKRSKDNTKSLPTLEEWNFMREIFVQVVDPNKKWEDDPVPPTLGYSLEKGIPAPPPYYPKASPGKGRGLFATRDIAKGELVHDGTHSDVIFPDAIAWRRYVFSLPREMACDCTDWHWMQKLQEGGPYYMLAGINISSLMNSGGIEFGPGREPNALPQSPTSGKFYATRDIRKHEEILTDYDSYYTNWREVGL